MSTLRLKFTLHRGFVLPGTYEVYHGGKKAIITVCREKNTDSLKKIFHRSTPANVSYAYDIHGIIYISYVTMTLTTSFDINQKANVSVNLKRECLNYLNRLIEVVRYKTRKYWLLPVSEYELLYAEIEDMTGGSGKAKKGHIVMSHVSATVNLPVKKESDVMDEIKFLLKSGQKIENSEGLILDAYNYIFTGQFNESIVTSNLALELFISENIRQILELVYSTNKEIDNALQKVTNGKLHNVFRNAFLGGKSHDEVVKSSEVYRKFDKVRTYRAQIVHHGKKLTMIDAEANIRNILQINFYLISKISEYGERVLQLSAK